MAKKELLGNFAVDSGQVMIGDPCYLDGFNNDDYQEDGVEHEYSYSGSCATTSTKENGGELFLNSNSGSPVSVVSSTGLGDGIYPVYAIKEEGRIKELIIKFF
jgi:hypothetical protein